MPDGPAFDHDGFDVIGDVHGCHEQLIDLLDGLGYSDESGVHRHRNRQVVFVGDLIDRGPGQVEVLRTVRSMVEAGTAQVVMGNHEFNAIAYATADPKCPDEFLRRHSDKNVEQHREFLSQIGAGSADHEEALAWFATLPLWLDLGGLRVVHACWDPEAMAGLGTPFVDPQTLVDASDQKHATYGRVENLCKGPEVRLPDGLSFHDKGGTERFDARFRWWDPHAHTYAQSCVVAVGTVLPDDPVEQRPIELYGDDVPVLFGHYWRDWPDVELTSTAACVDYSAVKGGPLVAYRWSGEPELHAENLFPSRR